MLTVNHPESPEEFEEYYDLRWRVLRGPWSQPRGSEKDEFDPTADYVTVRDEDGKLIGIGRMHLNNDREAQIRKIKILKCQIKPLEFSPNIQYFPVLSSPKSYRAVKQGQTDVGGVSDFLTVLNTGV